MAVYFLSVNRTGICTPSLRVDGSKPCALSLVHVGRRTKLSFLLLLAHRLRATCEQIRCAAAALYVCHGCSGLWARWDGGIRHPDGQPGLGRFPGGLEACHHRPLLRFRNAMFDAVSHDCHRELEPVRKAYCGEVVVGCEMLPG